MKKIGFLVLGIIGMLVIIGLNPVLAAKLPAEDQTPLNRWIDTVYRIDFVNMTAMNITAIFAVHEIEIQGFAYTADDIRENYTYDPEVGMAIINKTKEEVNNAFNSIVTTMFANDTVKCENTTEDKSTIIDVQPGGDVYQPPIAFTKNATITFNVTSFGFKEDTQLNLDDVIMGTLKMGATVNKAFTLKASAGYKNTFIITVPDYIKIVSKDDDYSNKTATWIVDNKNATNIDETTESSETLMIESREPLPSFDQNITIYTYIDIKHFDNRTEFGHHGIDINATIDIGSINISKYEDMLPESVSNLTFITPDGIRMVVGNNLTTWDEIENKTVNESKSKAEETLSNMFNSTVRLVFEWDNNSRLKGYDVNRMIGDPVISYMNTTEPAGFSPSSFDLNENASVHNVTIGVLKMGAVVEKEVEMKVSANIKNIVEFVFPDNVISENPVWVIDNLINSTEKLENKTLTIRHENPSPVNEEEILINVTIDMYDFDELYLYGTIDIKSANITKYNFPECIKNLSFVSSDGIRMALDNGLVSWEDIINEIINITKDAEKTLSDVFNTTIKLNFTSWDNREGYNLFRMGSERPINATIIALNETNSTKIKPNLFGNFDAETITGVLNAGAKYTFEIPSSDQNYTLRMILPKNIRLSNFSVSVECTTVENRNAYSWKSSKTLSCTFESKIAPEYNESRASLNILIDINNMDILRMLLVVDLNVDAQIYHVDISDVSMPKNLTIKYINSDCLRLLYRKGILKQSDIDNITDEIKHAFEKNLTNVLGENITIEINKAALNESLEQSYDISNMSDKVPVKISASTHIELRLSNLTQKQQGGETSAALTLFAIPLRFKLTAIKGWDTTYKLILPPELKIASVEDSLGKARKYTENGRDVFEVFVSGSESDEITINVDLTPLLLLFIVPGIVLSFMMFLSSLIIKIMDWRENKFIKKNF